MCIEVSAKPTFRIADKDIVTYKHLQPGRYSTFFRTHYQLHKTYVEEIAEFEVYSGYEFPYLKIIEKSYHSSGGLYSWEAISLIPKCYSRRVYKSIIPKGSKYYIAPDGQVISNALKVGFRINWLTKLLKLV